MGTLTQDPPTQLCMWQSRVFITLFIGFAVSNSDFSIFWWPFWSCFVFLCSSNCAFSFTLQFNFGPMPPDIGTELVSLGQPWRYTWPWELLRYLGLPSRFFSFCNAMGDPHPPICIVNRFRRSKPSLAQVTPPSASDGTSPKSAREHATRYVMGSTSPRDSSWSLTTSIPIFGAISDFSEVPAGTGPKVHPRWSHHGDYEFWDPLGERFRTPHAFGYSVPGRSRYAISLSSLHDPPTLIDDHTRWPAPTSKRMSRASLEPHLPVDISGLQVISLVQPLVKCTWCPDTPVQHAHPGEMMSAGLGTSLHSAWLDAKRDLDQTWLKLLQVMCDSGVLTQSTGGFSHAQAHQLRVISTVALSTLQSIFRIWQRWLDLVSTLDACPSLPTTFLRENWLAEHAPAPLQGATAYFKDLSWMANHAPLPDLMAGWQSSACKAYWLYSPITVNRESAPWPLSMVLFYGAPTLV